MHEDCLAALARCPPASADACVTDPPYGLSKEPDVVEVMRHWIAGDRYEHGASGFMGKTWDSFVPGPEYWREVYRVLKPGAHLLAFSGSRTWDLLSTAIRMAGFENRDTVGCPTLAWMQGQGKPQPLLDSDKVGAGIGTALKPAWEVILVFRKPLAGTVVENVLAHGTGALNIDATRIGMLNGGRHPANAVLMHAEGCERIGATKIKAITGGGGVKTPGAHGIYGAHAGHNYEGKLGYFDAAGKKTIEAWRCVEGCQVAELDTQTGTLTSGTGAVRRKTSKANVYGDHTADVGVAQVEYGDSGGASRFFYQAKASGDDRWFLCKVCDTAAPRKFINDHTHDRSDKAHLVQHPTTKPTDLMRWLCRLVTPVSGIVLDPFMGSGSTGVAALAEGFRFVGIEREADYIEIARARTAKVTT